MLVHKALKFDKIVVSLICNCWQDTQQYFKVLQHKYNAYNFTLSPLADTASAA